MRSERFSTQVQLLASVRKDGHEATAKDTGNSFTYRTDVGWVPHVPMDGLAGQPLVVMEDRGISAFDTHNRLVPVAGEPGQLAAIDEFGETQLAIRDTQGGIAVPVNFADGASHTVCSIVIPSGALGPNGFVQATVLARVVNTAGALSYSFGDNLSGGSLSTPSLSSNANNRALEYVLVAINQNSELVQAYKKHVKSSLFTTAASTSSAFDEALQVFDNGSVDTTGDWLLEFYIQASGAVTGTALCYGAAVEYGYVA